MTNEHDIASRFGAAGPGASATPRPDKIVRDLMKALEDVLPPQHGLFGGPLCGLRAVYEDGSDENTKRHKGWIAHEAVTRAYRALARAERGAHIDPREPDYSRSGIFAHHNCWKCQDGKLPCAQGHTLNCEYPVARND